MNSRVDATLLSADATGEQVDSLAREAVRLGCAAVCVNPVHVARATRAVAGSSVVVASVVGFPLGASPVEAKRIESRYAVGEGASELDIVAPIWAVVGGELSKAEDEIGALMAASPGVVHKIILETALLPRPALEAFVAILGRLRPEFAKTGTGYARPVTPEDVAELRRLLDPAITIKAAGGIRSRAEAEALIAAGAERLGLSRLGEVLGPTEPG